MNIVVSRKDGTFTTRTDRSMIREPKDFYMPDGVSSVQAYFCYYVKIMRTGKAIAPRFAARYIDSFGDGLLIYGLPDKAGEPISFIDGSTILIPGFKPICEADDEFINRATKDLCELSRFTTLKTGDVIIYELGEGITLHSGETLRIPSGADITIF